MWLLFLLFYLYHEKDGKQLNDLIPNRFCNNIETLSGFVLNMIKQAKKAIIIKVAIIFLI